VAWSLASWRSCRPSAALAAPRLSAARTLGRPGQLPSPWRSGGKPYRWGAEGPQAFDCSGLTWAAWQAAGVTIPRTAAGQLAGLPRVRGGLRPGDLLIYRTNGPSRRHVAMVIGRGRMVEALGRGIPVRVTGIRARWLGAVRPGAGR
jgi:peptidoglycan DL-endopeptidase CwlO